MRDIVTGKDSDFDLERLIMLFNTELANELGNLCNRALNMSQRFTGGIISKGGPFADDDLALQTSLAESTAAYRAAMDEFDIAKGLEALNRHVVHCNSYAERMKPWELNKDPDKKDRLATVLQHLAESVAHCAVLLSPVLPDAAAKLAAQLNLPSLADLTLATSTGASSPTATPSANPSPSSRRSSSTNPRREIARRKSRRNSPRNPLSDLRPGRFRTARFLCVKCSALDFPQKRVKPSE